MEVKWNYLFKFREFYLKSACRTEIACWLKHSGKWGLFAEYMKCLDFCLNREKQYIWIFIRLLHFYKNDSLYKNSSKWLTLCLCQQTTGKLLAA